MELKISSSISQIPASSLFNDGFELSDQTIIPSEDIAGSFSPEENKVELFIYDINTSLLESSYDYNGWTITQNSDTSKSGNTDTLQIDPSNDLIKRGYDVGDLYAVYNFVNYELSSSPTNLLYISEISSDRTEIKLNSNFTSNEDLELTFNDLQSKINNVDFFDEFYIASEGNNYNIGINLLLDTSTDQYSILIKLYDALPDTFSIKDEIYVATKVAETQAYEVKFFNDLDLDIDDTPYLRGPNYNLEIKDFVNNSTELKSKPELLDATTVESNNNLQNVLNQKGVKITPNYSFSTFDEFVNFSSAKKRIENFYEKVSQIQSYESDIATIKTSITGSTSGSIQVSSSLTSANTNIENIIKNFDGYEYHLFYNSGSSAYPKTSGSIFPYPLQSVDSTEVLQWLGSDIEGSSTYGGIILSASSYDNNNQNWLYYNIPEFIRDNQDNNNYIDFSNMVGQHFDEIWLYTKAVTEKNNTTNELDKGIPLKLSQDAIKSLGYEGFGNNFNNQNNYMGLIGEEDGSYVPSTGNEIIDNYIAINNGTVINYWSPAYSFLFYVEQLGEPGFPYPIDKVSKEIYKRLYHNMAYLVKKKGTVSGLRQLINIWGIPDTILRINEFGGKNKDNTDDYDYWYNRYSYAFSPIANQNYASASAIIPWMPLERNRVTNNEYIVPDNLQFRFKTSGYPSSSYAGEFFSQSLAVKKSDGDETSTNFDFGIGLFYTGSATGSYSGSSDDTYKNWGVVRFFISGSTAEGGTVVSDDIYLPFYDNGWWSVMLQRDTHPSASVHTTDTNYTLYVKNKTYNGKDRNQISFQGSASISINGSTSSSINESWNKFGTGSHDGIYLGGFVSGSNIGSNTLNPPGKIFSGSLQEFRYYSNNIPETVFNDFVMNPESIEGNNITGLESSFDIVNFRAPLGNELEDKFETSISSSHTESFTSFHPAVSAKSTLLITGSFVNPDGNVTSSNYHIRYYENSTTRTFSQPNTEVYFLDQPAIGIRNRISNKIEIDDADDFGTVLSSQISIEQDYEISRSYTEDITSLEVAFSPQDNVNDDIIQAFGYGIVSDALADPRFTSSSTDHYPKLRESAEYFFQKYTEGNIYDYIRLIKYVDNSLFKAIKAYVPARTSVSTGIIIKQHMLERNRFSPPSITNKTPIAVASDPGYNSPLLFKNLELTSSINIGEVEGEAGGVINKFNYTGSPSFGETSITQSYNNTFDTVFGLQTIVEDTQKEFYDGEYSGSIITATTQSLFHNPFKIFSNSSETIALVNTTTSSLTPLEIPLSSFPFDNSIYNATINNVILNRPNTFLQDVDYSSNAVTPVNLNLITGGLAIKANTPDSNYTMRRVTRPRYEGSRLQSADYNFSTPPSSSITFLSGETGSYSGDESFGNTAVVDKNPIFFAHFKTSNESKELFDSYLFKVDALIGLPFEDITGDEESTSIPKIIKLDGSNNNLYETSKVFEPNREALISYDILSNIGNTPSPTLLTTTDALLNSITQNVTSTFGDITYSNEQASGGSGNGLIVSVTRGPLSPPNPRPVISITVTTPGRGYKVGDILTFNLGGASSLTFKITLNEDDFITSSTPTIDLSSLSVGSNKIYQGGLEYQLVNGSEMDETSFLTSQEYKIAVYCKNTKNNLNNLSNKFPLGASSAPPSKFNRDLQYWMKKDTTAVTDFENAGRISLGGGKMSLTQSYQVGINASAQQTEARIEGASLALINTLNTQLSRPFSVKVTPPSGGSFFIPLPGGITFYNEPNSPNVGFNSTTGTIGFTPYIGFNTSTQQYDPKPFKEIQNYFKFNIKESFGGSYEDSNEIFIIKPGDELRITYNRQADTPSPEIYNCTILKVTQSLSPPIKVVIHPLGFSGFFFGDGVNGSNLTEFTFQDNSVFDTLIVTPPPPTDLDLVYNFTIRRRIQADNRVILFQSPPINSDGANTPTGEGYIIPNDCTPTQKRNALTLISQLKGTNTFT